MRLPILQEYQRRILIPGVGLGLALYYLLVFLPLSRRTQALDVPLNSAWKNLAGAMDSSNAVSLDFEGLTNQLQGTRQALAAVFDARKHAAAELQLSPDLRARMQPPFHLVEYENERSKAKDDLSKLAREQQVTLDPAVLAGFPEETFEVQEPALLWPALSFIDGLLRTAIRAKVSALHSLELPPALTNAPPPYATGRLAEIPMQLELSGPVSNVLLLLRSLPLNGASLTAAGLPADAAKPPLFIERLIIKKQTPEKPDDVRVVLRAVGYVLQE